jgi:hypothetical protein
MRLQTMVIEFATPALALVDLFIKLLVAAPLLIAM